jgi:hypothetical protein
MEDGHGGASLVWRSIASARKVGTNSVRSPDIARRKLKAAHHSVGRKRDVLL